MAARAIEREIKFAVGPVFSLPDLTRVVDDVRQTELPEAELVATYYDTPDRRLLRRGITLRHRRNRTDPSDQGQWTLKLPVRVGGIALERTELTWPGELCAVPGEAVGLVRAIVRHAELESIAELVTRRRRLEIKAPDGRRLAEIDDDVVDAADGSSSGGRFRELEVELEADDAALRDSLIARLAAAGARRGRASPKVAHALGMDGSARAQVEVKPRTGDMSLGKLVSAAIATGLERLVEHDLGVRQGADPEHVHQARVATRRLRSNLRTFADVFEPTWTARMREELRWLGRALGRVRDADVLALRLRTHAVEELTERDQQGFADLMRRLSLQREAAYAEMLEVLDSDRYVDLLDALAEAPAFRAGRDRELTMRAEKAAVRFVRRPWESLRRAVAKLKDDPTDEQLHQVRIKAKRLRYSADVAEAVVGKPARRLAKAAADLQDILGAHHDAVTAEGWLRESAAALKESAGIFVAGELVSIQRREQRELRQTWPEAWDRLSTKRLTRWLR